MTPQQPSGAFDQEAHAILSQASVALVGVGGIGGYSLEMLVRLGIGHLSIIDGDVVSASNLDRQLLSLPGNIGQSKAELAYSRARAISPSMGLTVHAQYLTRDNAPQWLAGHDVVLDATDSVASRQLVGEVCQALHLPLVHAGVSGWCVQASLIIPGEDRLTPLLSQAQEGGHTPCPSFAPAVAAALQVAEAVKLLLHLDGQLHHQLMYIDLMTAQSQRIPL